MVNRHNLKFTFLSAKIAFQVVKENANLQHIGTLNTIKKNKTTFQING